MNTMSMGGNVWYRYSIRYQISIIGKSIVLYKIGYTNTAKQYKIDITATRTSQNKGCLKFTVLNFTKAESMVKIL